MRLTMTLIAAAAACALVGGKALAAGSGFSPADTAALKAYVLTTDKVQRYGAALQMMRKDQAAHPELRKEEEVADDEPGRTLADLLAKLKRHPQLAAYYHKAGLSDLDAVMVPIVSMNAAVAAQMPAAAAKLPVTPAQIEFAKAHGKELAAMKGGG
ncbi:MAG: hypothetical protein ACJ798_14275 [Phenylobacterium sp.]